MLRLPAYVQFEITDVCNLRCKHCYHFDTNEMPKSQNLDDNQTIRLVEKLVNAQIYSLIITGGEPLTRFDLTSRAVELAKDAGIFVSINTNLLLLTQEMLACLTLLGVDSFLVSCPASDPKIYRQITRCGNYQQFYDKLKLLLGSKISCLINMVATKSNHRLVRSTAVDMAKLGVKRFAVTIVSINVEHPDFESLLSASQIITIMEDLRWCAENLGLTVDILEPLPKCFFPPWCWEKEYAFTRRACQAGRMSASISNTGDVRPCSHNPIVYGNLFEEQLETIWGKMSMYRDGRTGVVPTLCQCCPAVASCNGACRTNALAITGQLNQPDRLIVKQIGWPQKKPSEIVVRDDSIISGGKIRWRKEAADMYSVSSLSNRSNLMVVNEELFRFIRWLEKSLPLTIKELAINVSDNSNWEALLKIIRVLIQRGIICITKY